MPLEAGRPAKRGGGQEPCCSTYGAPRAVAIHRSGSMFSWRAAASVRQPGQRPKRKGHFGRFARTGCGISRGDVPGGLGSEEQRLALPSKAQNGRAIPDAAAFQPPSTLIIPSLPPPLPRRKPISLNTPAQLRDGAASGNSCRVSLRIDWGIVPHSHPIYLSPSPSRTCL